MKNDNYFKMFKNDKLLKLILTIVILFQTLSYLVLSQENNEFCDIDKPNDCIENNTYKYRLEFLLCFIKFLKIQ